MKTLFSNMGKVKFVFVVLLAVACIILSFGVIRTTTKWNSAIPKTQKVDRKVSSRIQDLKIQDLKRPPKGVKDMHLSGKVKSIREKTEISRIRDDWSIPYRSIPLDNIYVDPSRGDDNNSGNSILPLKTITKAVESINEGGIIFLKRGTYDTSSGENFPIYITKNMTIKGILADGSIIIKGGHSDAPLFRIQVSNLEVVFKKIKFINTLGGAISSSGEDSILEVEDCSFGNNHAVYGGAINSENGKLAVIDSVFTNNSATGSGGAIDFTTLDSEAERYIYIESCEFYDNKAEPPASDLPVEYGRSGGAVGIVARGDDSSATIKKCKFFNNIASGGNNSHDPSTSAKGGAIYVSYCKDVHIENCLFVKCKVLNNDKETEGRGGAVNVLATNLYVVNNTFYMNEAGLSESGTAHRGGRGGGICADYNGGLYIKNNIFTKNSSSAITLYSRVNSRLPDLSYNLFDSNMVYDLDSEHFLNSEQLNNDNYSTEGHNIIGSDTTLFEDPENNDFHLKDNSPGIDSGTDSSYVPEDDLNNNPRPRTNNGEIDRGAYEQGT